MGIDKPVTSLVTQVVVDRSDEAFANPTKPIGRFMDRDEAAEWERRGCRVIEDSGRGVPPGGAVAKAGGYCGD